MGRRVVASLLLLAACKAELASMTGDANNSQLDDSGLESLDAPTDAPVPLGAWSTPQLIPGASDDNVAEDDCTLSSDKLELYFKRDDGDNNNLYRMTRASVTSAWSAPDPLGVLNTGSDEESPRLSHDDLTLYFGRGGDIYMTTRTAVGMPWGSPVPVTALNTGAYEKWADVCSNGYVIVSRSVSGNGQDLFHGTITGGAPDPIAAFNTDDDEQGTFLSADCLKVYFQSNRDNQFDIYEATRTALGAAWSNPTKLTDFNTTTSSEEDPWLSTDQRVFVYTSNVNGTKDLFISTR